MLYKTLILPIIDYGDMFYDCISQKNAMILQRIQNMALKSVLKVPKCTSTAEIHANLTMLTLSQHRTLHSAKQMFRVSKEDGPPSLVNRFQKLSRVTTKETRSTCRGSFEIPKCNLQGSQRNFVYRGTKLWEGLPCKLKTIDDIDMFVGSTKQ